jgi:hypothetical protein
MSFVILSFASCSEADFVSLSLLGFLALQSVIAQATRAAALPGTECANKKTATTFVQQQALPPYHRSFASVEFQLFTALYMVLALSPVLQTTLAHIVKEKEILVKVNFLTLCNTMMIKSFKRLSVTGVRSISCF